MARTAPLHAAAEQLDQRWAASGASRVRRVPGEPCARARLHAGLRQ
ncbi:DUF6207 family protein [Streptomyces sp. NPDC020472]